MATLWNPVKPVTVTLTVECESHDAVVVIAEMVRQADALQESFGDNIGPVTIKNREGRNED